jgi:hypothetical protein
MATVTARKRPTAAPDGFGRRHLPLSKRQVDKLMVSENSDGSVTVRPTVPTMCFR